MDWLECPAGEFQALARELLGQGHSVRLRVSGCSMHPFVHTGDLVEIRPAGPEKVRAGDLVLFALGERLFLHRVIGLRLVGDEVRLFARGDNNVASEPEFGAMELLGVAVAVRRGEVVIDLRSGWKRWIGWVMARCGPVRRIVLKAARRWPGRGLPPFLPGFAVSPGSDGRLLHEITDAHGRNVATPSPQPACAGRRKRGSTHC